MKIVIVLGTRPEITKLSELIRGMKKAILVFTGQHYDFKLAESFFDVLDLRKPDYRLIIDNRSFGTQISSMINNIEMVLLSERPDIMINLGDTNSTLASALIARNMGLDLMHIEAGCRSSDRSMIEERNRKMIDAIATIHISPTDYCTKNLTREGIRDTVYQIGHPITDTINYILPKLRKNSFISHKILLTIHRRENIGDNLKFIMKEIEKLDIPVLFPIHPHTRKKLYRLNLKLKNIEITPPLPFMEFLEAMRSSRAVLTDSGGVQQEAFLLGIPCITLRSNTEWKETLDYGGNFLLTNIKDLGVILNRVLSEEEVIRKNIRYNNSTIYGNNVTKSIIRLTETIEDHLERP